uniref:hypothetical protein n=1 Tax=Bartonella sp. AP72JLCBS TaxID=3243502 RepID=UPI0035D12402
RRGTGAVGDSISQKADGTLDFVGGIDVNREVRLRICRKPSQKHISSFTENGMNGQRAGVENTIVPFNPKVPKDSLGSEVPNIPNI